MRSENKRKMVQCRSLVKSDAIRRESLNGVEHIVVSSYTLPDDIVMNGGLYPKEEVEKSYHTLNLTLAPVEHPSINGEFISANDDAAISDFHVGAFNMNARLDNGRVYVDKLINIEEAKKSEKGMRLLERIEELETNKDARPIHSSVGVFLSREDLNEIQTNAAGDEFSWIARDLVFDHDAFLLDSVGAAQPHQGVGVAVNSKGEKCALEVNLMPGWVDESMGDPIADKEEISFNDIEERLNSSLTSETFEYERIERVYPDRVIFWSKESLYEVPYTINEQGITQIVGIPLRVQRNVTYTPKTNELEGNAMKDLITNALKNANVEVEGLSDEALLQAYFELQANQSKSESGIAGDSKALAEAVANAVTQVTKPLADQIDGLKAKLNANEESEISKLADVVANSGKYPALDAESAKMLPVEKLKEMAANCQSSFGLLATVNSTSQSDSAYSAPSDMPE